MNELKKANPDCPLCHGGGIIVKDEWQKSGQSCYLCFPTMEEAIKQKHHNPSTLSPEIGEGGGIKVLRWVKASERLPGLGAQAFAFEQEAPVYRGTLERNKSEPKELWWRFWKTTVILREGDGRLNDIFWLEETDVSAAQPTESPATGEVSEETFEGAEYTIKDAIIEMRQLQSKLFSAQQEITQLKEDVAELTNDRDEYKGWYNSAQANITALTNDCSDKAEKLKAIVKACKPLKGNPTCDYIRKIAEEGSK